MLWLNRFCILPCGHLGLVMHFPCAVQMRIAQDRAKQTRRITIAFRRLFRLSEVSRCSHASWQFLQGGAECGDGDSWKGHSCNNASDNLCRSCRHLAWVMATFPCWLHGICSFRWSLSGWPTSRSTGAVYGFHHCEMHLPSTLRHIAPRCPVTTTPAITHAMLSSRDHAKHRMSMRCVDYAEPLRVSGHWHAAMSHSSFPSSLGHIMPICALALAHLLL